MPNNRGPQRKRSFGGLRYTLDLDRLLRFFREHVATCNSPVIVGQAQSMLHTIRNQAVDTTQLQDAVVILESFIDLRSLSSVVVFEAHSFVGLIRESLFEFASARQSFLRALWIASSSNEVTPENLAVTMHRLAKVIASQRDYAQAKCLFEKARDTYAQAHVSSSHPCVVACKEALRSVQQAIQEDEAINRTWTRLSFVEEENEGSRALSVSS